MLTLSDHSYSLQNWFAANAKPLLFSTQKCACMQPKLAQTRLVDVTRAISGNWNQKTRNLRTSHQILHIYRDYSVHWCFSDNVSVPPPPAHKEATFVTQNTTTTAESNNNNINNNNNKEMFTVSPFSHQSVHLQTAFFFFSHSVACVFHL